MRRTWLIFSQAVTVAVAMLFVVSTLKPEWLPRRAGTASVVTLPPVPQALPAQPVALAPPAAVSSYATPRRLAAHITGVLGKAQDKAVQIKLMPVAVGLGADGQPSPALLKKLQALGQDASAVANLRFNESLRKLPTTAAIRY